MPLAGLLHEAVQRINGEITEQDVEIDEISDEREKAIPADPNVRNFSFAVEALPENIKGSSFRLLQKRGSSPCC